MLLSVLILSPAVEPKGHAQQLTGTLSGTVKDSSGGMVPGAHISLINATSGDQRTAVSDPAGRWVITAVQPAAYSLKVEAQGYKAWREDGNPALDRRPRPR
jgi:hypothetical protein